MPVLYLNLPQNRIRHAPPCGGPASLTPVGRFLGKQRGLVRHGRALALQIAGDRMAQAWIPDPMRAVGGDRKIAAGELVRPLRASLDRAEPPRNREIDGLVVTDLEMQ